MKCEPNELTVEKIAYRVYEHKEQYVTKFEKKDNLERVYYANKQAGLSEAQE